MNNCYTSENNTINTNKMLIILQTYIDMIGDNEQTTKMLRDLLWHSNIHVVQRIRGNYTLSKSSNSMFIYDILCTDQYLLLHDGVMGEPFEMICGTSHECVVFNILDAILILQEYYYTETWLGWFTKKQFSYIDITAIALLIASCTTAITVSKTK